MSPKGTFAVHLRHQKEFVVLQLRHQYEPLQYNCVTTVNGLVPILVHGFEDFFHTQAPTSVIVRRLINTQLQGIRQIVPHALPHMLR
jgi:hypothetical protein